MSDGETPWPLQGTEASLCEILDAREERARRQVALLLKGGALVCLTVNMPGPVKRCALTKRVFEAGMAALICSFPAASIMEVIRMDLKTGPEGYLRVDAPAEQVKRVACHVEEELPYGRLLDADVLAGRGRSIHRSALGLPLRGCMVCGKPGAYCASSRAHSVEELRRAALRLGESLCLEHRREP